MVQQVITSARRTGCKGGLSVPATERLDKWLCRIPSGMYDKTRLTGLVTVQKPMPRASAFPMK
jgi:hypothetical protein